MRKAGIEIPKITSEDLYFTYPRTEEEGDRINLAQTILELKGTVIKGYPGVCCPHCKSEILASVGYPIADSCYRKFIKVFHAPGDRDALFLNGDWGIRFDVPEDRKKEHSAYICLQCGREFGNLELTSEVEDAYKKHLEERSKK